MLCTHTLTHTHTHTHIHTHTHTRNYNGTSDNDTNLCIMDKVLYLIKFDSIRSSLFETRILLLYMERLLFVYIVSVSFTVLLY